MFSEAYRDLIQKLFVRTQEGRVEWQPTAESTVFLAPIGKHVFSIRAWFNPATSRPTVTVEVLKSSGEKVDSFNVTQREPDDYVWLMDLHELARRKALNIDNAINEMLGDLDEATSSGEGEDNDVPF